VTRARISDNLKQEGAAMKNQTPYRVLLGAGTAVVASVALAFAATAGGSGTADSIEIAKLKQQVAALRQEVKAHPMILSKLDILTVSSRIAFIDAAGFHGMEGGWATTPGGLTARQLEAATNALRVTSKISWPEALKYDASTFQTNLRAFIAAMQAGDKAKAFETLKAAHAAQHALSAAAWKYLS
jgi:hypothetical protein